MKIAVAGAGYVGLSNAVLLSQQHTVVVVDIDETKVDHISRRESPIEDPEIEQYLSSRDLDLSATTDAAAAFAGADFVLVATPTDYDETTNYFNSSSVESVIGQVLAVNNQANIVIKSTVPVGFTVRMNTEHPGTTIIFSPEFLREGRALYDTLHPSRIVVGSDSAAGHQFAGLMIDSSLDEDVPVLFTGPTEAEAIKLFANTYLALRVAYFNELDTYAAVHQLDATQIIDGVGLDQRIGAHYNNPSFGYGGYCLPKDSKQLRANYDDVPQDLISAIVEANTTRKNFIAADVLRQNPQTVGIYRLTMKSGSDNFRDSSVLGVIERLKANGVDVVIYEPGLSSDELYDSPVIEDLESFKRRCDVIVANRRSAALDDVAAKVYTRDIYGRD